MTNFSPFGQDKTGHIVVSRLGPVAFIGVAELLPNYHSITTLSPLFLQRLWPQKTPDLSTEMCLVLARRCWDRVEKATYNGDDIGLDIVHTFFNFVAEFGECRVAAALTVEAVSDMVGFGKDDEKALFHLQDLVEFLENGGGNLGFTIETGVTVFPIRFTGENNRVIIFLFPAEMLCKERETQKRADCAYCGKSGIKFKLCSGCKSVRYCSVACQKKDWKKHKMACSKVVQKE